MNDPTRFRMMPALAALVVVLASMLVAPAAWAASHREAPLISMDPTADITDVYAFRSWENPSKAVFIMNVIPQQVPASGPNFYNFDDDVTYAMHFDLSRDGRAQDLVVRFRFKTEIRPPFNDLPVAYAGANRIVGLPPAITALDGPGSEGLGLRQLYTVQATGRVVGQTSTDRHGRKLIAVPSNIGPRTMPNYPALADKGIFELPAAMGISGVRVFAGSREETFYIDLGSAFDTLNFRRNPPVLTNAEDANDSANAFGVDDGFEGLNVTTIALEIPISALPRVVGMYASTSRGGRQQARMGNPLVNELIIGTGFKDRWNFSDPAGESQFIGFYRNPRLAALLKTAYGIPIPPTPRNDLVAILLQYPPGPGGTGIISELLRLDLSVPPRRPENQRRLGPLAHDAAGNPTPDPAGWPNGRRPNDDVTDIALRVIAGVLSGHPCCDQPPHTRLGDGVNFNKVRPGTPDVTFNGIAREFPFLPTPNPGRSPSPPLQLGPDQPLFR